MPEGSDVYYFAAVTMSGLCLVEHCQRHFLRPFLQSLIKRSALKPAGHGPRMRGKSG